MSSLSLEKDAIIKFNEHNPLTHPLVVALRKNDLEYFKHLLNHGHPINDYNSSAIRYASSECSFEINLILLELGADPFVNRFEPLFNAVGSKNLDLVKHLVSLDGINLYFTDDENPNGIDGLAAWWGHLEILEYLHSINFDFSRHQYGAFKNSLTFGHVESARYLLSIHPQFTPSDEDIASALVFNMQNTSKINHIEKTINIIDFIFPHLITEKDKKHIELFDKLFFSYFAFGVHEDTEQSHQLFDCLINNITKADPDFHFKQQLIFSSFNCKDTSIIKKVLSNKRDQLRVEDFYFCIEQGYLELVEIMINQYHQEWLQPIINHHGYLGFVEKLCLKINNILLNPQNEAIFIDGKKRYHILDILSSLNYYHVVQTTINFYKYEKLISHYDRYNLIKNLEKINEKDTVSKKQKI